MRFINLEKMRIFIRNIFEDSSEISVSQEELEDMLTAIVKLSVEYEKGKISKDVFSADKEKLKKESLKIVKNINKTIIDSTKLLDLMNKEISAQKIIKDEFHGYKKDKNK
jgi:hypothetical protein